MQKCVSSESKIWWTNNFKPKILLSQERGLSTTKMMKMKELVLYYGTLLEKFGGRELIQMALVEGAFKAHLWARRCAPLPHPWYLFLFLFLGFESITSDFWVCTHFPILVLGIESIKFGFQNNWCVLGFMVFTCFHYCLPIVKLLYSEFRVILIFHYWIWKY